MATLNSQTIKNQDFDKSICGKALFFMQLPNKTGFRLGVSIAGDNLYLVELDKAYMAKVIENSNFFATFEMPFAPVCKMIFDISEDDALQIAQNVLNGSDFWEEINIFDDLCSQELANKENDDIVQNEYWEQQPSLSFSN